MGFAKRWQADVKVCSLFDAASKYNMGFVHLVGFVVLLTLIAIISYLDILRILRGQSIL